MNTFSIQDTLQDTWKLTKEHFGFLVGLSLIFFIASFALGFLGAIPVLGFLTALAVQIGMKMGLIRVILDLVRGTKRPYGDLFKTWKPFWVFLGASLLMGIIVSIGTILLIIPGIIAAIAMQFYAYEVVDGHKGVTDSLKSSAEMTKGNRWKLFWFILLLGLINAIGAMVFGLGLLVTMPFSAIAMAMAYEKLRGATPPKPESTVEQSAPAV